MKFSLLNAIRQAITQFKGRHTGNIPNDSLIRIDRGPPDWWQEEMSVYAGISTLRHSPFSQNFTLETREMREAYRRWPAEPSAKAALAGKVFNVAALGLQVTPSQKGNERSHEIADFVRHCLKRPLIGWPGVIYEMFIHSLTDGWSVCEPVWEREERGRFRGKRVMRDFKSKDTRYIVPLLDQYKNIVGLYNTHGNAGKVFDPKDFVIYSHLPMFRNPTGTSDLRAAYRAMRMIVDLVRIRMIYLDKFSGPFLRGKARDPAVKAKMASELAKARADGYIVLDGTSDVDAIEIATRGTADFQAALDDMRKEIATSISGAFLHMMTAADPNARGDSQVQQDTTDLFVWWLAEMAAVTIQHQLVPLIVDVNYGATEDLPTVSLEAVKPQDIVSDLGIDNLLAQIGVDTSLEELRDRARRSPPKDPNTDSVLKSRQASQQPAQPPGPPVGNPFAALGFSEPPPGHKIYLVPDGFNLSIERFPTEDEKELQAFDSFAEETKFTGTRKDRLGRTICWQNGRRVPCTGHAADPKKKPLPDVSNIGGRMQRWADIEAIVSAKGATALWEIDRLGEVLKTFDHEDLQNAYNIVTDRYTPDITPKDKDAARMAIINHLKLQRKEWWKKNQKAPSMVDPADIVPEKVAPTIDYRHRDANHPIAKAIAADEQGRQLVTDFLTKFSDRAELAKKSADLSDQHFEAWKAANAAGSEYTAALLEWSRFLYSGGSKGLKGKAKSDKEKELKDKRDAAKAKSDELSAKAADLALARDSAAEAKRTISHDARTWLVDHIKPAGERSNFDYTMPTEKLNVSGVYTLPSLETSAEGKAAIGAGHYFAMSMSANVTEPVAYYASDTGRAFYNENLKRQAGRPVVTLNGTYASGKDGYSVQETAETTAHELGHHIEKHKPGLAKAANEFRKYRTEGETPTQLKSLPGGEGYSPYEYGLKDNFDRVFDGSTNVYYVGKSYGTTEDAPTEIVSMGLEALYRDPVKFAQADPEYFQWLVTNLSR